MYADPANKAYLAFLQPLVTQVNRVNKLFESDHCNVSKLLEELMSLYQSLLNRLMLPRTFPTWESITTYDVSFVLLSIVLGLHIPFSCLYYYILGMIVYKHYIKFKPYEPLFAFTGMRITVRSPFPPIALDHYGCCFLQVSIWVCFWRIQILPLMCKVPYIIW